MDKAKLTREQVSALNAALEHKTPAEVVEFHANENTYWDYRREPLLHLDMDTLCRALYVGYEIVEEDQTVVIDEKIRAELKRQHDGAFDMPTHGTVGAFQSGFRTALKCLGVKHVNIEQEESR